MKKIFFEIGLVALFTLLYLLVPQVRIALIVVFGVLAIWILPVQLFLSINFQIWQDELSGRYNNLPLSNRLQQIKKTFDGLDQMESDKLRLFYIQVSAFHYCIMLLYALSFAIVGFLWLRLGVHFKDTYIVAFSLIGFIVTCFVGYYLIGKLFPASEKKSIDYTRYLFLRNDWRKYIFSDANLIKEDNNITNLKVSSFYNYWLPDATVEEKEVLFKNFLISLNQHSNNGILFKFNSDGKVEIVPIIHPKAFNKTLAGFLKYCIEDQKTLDDAILHHGQRDLLRDVFVLDPSKDLVFLEGQRYKDTPEEYINVYRRIVKV